jgi:hypothetical protein
MAPTPLASTSVKRHYARGGLGLLALVTAAVGAVTATPVLLGFLVLTVAAWRGCPTCWAIGLMQTRECADGLCRRGDSRH